VSTDAYREVINASARDRLDLFLATANRLGAPIGNIKMEAMVGRASATTSLVSLH